MIRAHSGECGGTRTGVSLLAVLVLLAVGGEALGLQELGRGSPLVEQALVFFEEFLLFLQSRLLIRVEALQLLETTLQLEEGEVTAAVSLQLNKKRTESFPRLNLHPPPSRRPSARLPSPSPSERTSASSRPLSSAAPPGTPDVWPRTSAANCSSSKPSEELV